MSDPTVILTNITPPRVPLTDSRTGLISREWYRFFFNLFQLTGSGTNYTTLTDLQVGPPAQELDLTTVDPVPAGFAAYAAGSTQESQIAEIEKQLQGLASTNDVNVVQSQVAEVQKQLQALGATPPLLNSNTLNTNYLDFEVDAPSTPMMGRMGWNSFDQTLNLGMEYDVVQQIGLETYARVANFTGVTIPNGTVVGFTGAVPDSALSVAPYLADGATNTLYIVGVMTHDLPDSGEKGYCTTWGFVRDVDTSGFTLGDILYASPTVAGAFTNVKPTAPNNVVPVAAVLQIGTTDGVIFVRPTIEQQIYYGEFTKTNSQSPAVINTAYPLLFTNTEIANGVSIGTTTSEIYVAQAGLYNIACSVQITSNNSAQKSIWVWLRKNGTTDFPNSARVASITLNNGYLVVTLNEVASLLAGDFIEVMYAADNTNVSIATVAATAFAPAAPAVILAVTQTEQ
jgi:hypothetical protein